MFGRSLAHSVDSYHQPYYLGYSYDPDGTIFSVDSMKSIILYPGP